MDFAFNELTPQDQKLLKFAAAAGLWCAMLYEDSVVAVAADWSTLGEERLVCGYLLYYAATWMEVPYGTEDTNDN